MRGGDIRTPRASAFHGQAAETLLYALADHLAASDNRYTIAVVGGSALLTLGLISRATQDIDVLAIVEDHVLISAQPLPEALRRAARLVARDFGLAEDWLNPGPADNGPLGL